MDIFPLKSMVIFFFHGKVRFFFMVSLSKRPKRRCSSKSKRTTKYMLEINSLYQGDSASQYSIFCAKFEPIVFSPFFLLSRQSLKFKISASPQRQTVEWCRISQLFRTPALVDLDQYNNNFLKIIKR